MFKYLSQSLTTILFLSTVLSLKELQSVAGQNMNNLNLGQANSSGKIVINDNQEVSFCLNRDYLAAFGSSYYNMGAFRATEMPGSQKVFLAASLTKTEELFVGRSEVAELLPDRKHIMTYFDQASCQSLFYFESSESYLPSSLAVSALEKDQFLFTAGILEKQAAISGAWILQIRRVNTGENSFQTRHIQIPKTSAHSPQTEQKLANLSLISSESLIWVQNKFGVLIDLNLRSVVQIQFEQNSNPVSTNLNLQTPQNPRLISLIYDPNLLLLRQRSLEINFDRRVVSVVKALDYRLTKTPSNPSLGFKSSDSQSFCYKDSNSLILGTFDTVQPFQIQISLQTEQIQILECISVQGNGSKLQTLLLTDPNMGTKLTFVTLNKQSGSLQFQPIISDQNSNFREFSGNINPYIQTLQSQFMLLRPQMQNNSIFGQNYYGFLLNMNDQTRQNPLYSSNTRTGTSLNAQTLTLYSSDSKLMYTTSLLRMGEPWSKPTNLQANLKPSGTIQQINDQLCIKGRQVETILAQTFNCTSDRDDCNSSIALNYGVLSEHWLVSQNQPWENMCSPIVKLVQDQDSLKRLGPQTGFKIIATNIYESTFTIKLTESINQRLILRRESIFGQQAFSEQYLTKIVQNSEQDQKFAQDLREIKLVPELPTKQIYITKNIYSDNVISIKEGETLFEAKIMDGQWKGAEKIRIETIDRPAMVKVVQQPQNQLRIVTRTDIDTKFNGLYQFKILLSETYSKEREEYYGRQITEYEVILYFPLAKYVPPPPISLGVQTQIKPLWEELLRQQSEFKRQQVQRREQFEFNPRSWLDFRPQSERQFKIIVMPVSQHGTARINFSQPLTSLDSAEQLEFGKHLNVTLFTALGVDPDQTEPELENVKITSVDTSGFTINLFFKRAEEMSRTAFDRDFIQISLNIEHLLTQGEKGYRGGEFEGVYWRDLPQQDQVQKGDFLENYEVYMEGFTWIMCLIFGANLLLMGLFGRQKYSQLGWNIILNLQLVSLLALLHVQLPANINGLNQMISRITMVNFANKNGQNIFALLLDSLFDFPQPPQISASFQFQQIGITSYNSVQNAVGLLLMPLLIILPLFLLMAFTLLMRQRSDFSTKLFKFLQNNIFFSFFIRYTIQFYLPLLIVYLVSMRDQDWLSSWSLTFSKALTVIHGLFLVTLPIQFWSFYSFYYDHIVNDIGFRRAWDAPYCSLRFQMDKTENLTMLYRFPVICLTKSLLISLAFSVFQAYLGVQTAIIIVLTFAKLFFLMVKDPYEEKVLHKMDIFGEAVTIVQVYLLCGLTMVSQDPVASFYGVGMTYIVLLAISTTIMALIFSYFTVRECIFALKMSAVKVLAKNKRSAKFKGAVSKLRVMRSMKSSMGSLSSPPNRDIERTNLLFESGKQIVVDDDLIDNDEEQIKVGLHRGRTEVVRQSMTDLTVAQPTTSNSIFKRGNSWREIAANLILKKSHTSITKNSQEKEGSKSKSSDKKLSTLKEINLGDNLKIENSEPKTKIQIETGGMRRGLTQIEEEDDVDDIELSVQRAASIKKKASFIELKNAVAEDLDESNASSSMEVSLFDSSSHYNTDSVKDKEVSFTAQVLKIQSSESAAPNTIAAQMNSQSNPAGAIGSKQKKTMGLDMIQPREMQRIQKELKAAQNVKTIPLRVSGKVASPTKIDLNYVQGSPLNKRQKNYNLSQGSVTPQKNASKRRGQFSNKGKLKSMIVTDRSIETFKVKQELSNQNSQPSRYMSGKMPSINLIPLRSMRQSPEKSAANNNIGAGDQSPFTPFAGRRSSFHSELGSEFADRLMQVVELKQMQKKGLTQASRETSRQNSLKSETSHSPSSGYMFPDVFTPTNLDSRTPMNGQNSMLPKKSNGFVMGQDLARESLLVEEENNIFTMSKLISQDRGIQPAIIQPQNAIYQDPYQNFANHYNNDPTQTQYSQLLNPSRNIVTPPQMSSLKNKSVHQRSISPPKEKPGEIKTLKRKKTQKMKKLQDTKQIVEASMAQNNTANNYFTNLLVPTQASIPLVRSNTYNKAKKEAEGDGMLKRGLTMKRRQTEQRRKKRQREAVSQINRQNQPLQDPDEVFTPKKVHPRPQTALKIDCCKISTGEMSLKQNSQRIESAKKSLVELSHRSIVSLIERENLKFDLSKFVAKNLGRSKLRVPREIADQIKNINNPQFVKKVISDEANKLANTSQTHNKETITQNQVSEMVQKVISQPSLTASLPNNPQSGSLKSPSRDIITSQRQQQPQSVAPKACQNIKEVQDEILNESPLAERQGPTIPLSNKERVDKFLEGLMAQNSQALLESLDAASDVSKFTIKQSAEDNEAKPF